MDLIYDDRDVRQPWRVFQDKNIIYFAKTKEEAEEFMNNPELHFDKVKVDIAIYSGA